MPGKSCTISYFTFQSTLGFRKKKKNKNKPENEKECWQLGQHNLWFHI